MSVSLSNKHYHYPQKQAEIGEALILVRNAQWLAGSSGDGLFFYHNNSHEMMISAPYRTSFEQQSNFSKYFHMPNHLMFCPHVFRIFI